MELSRLSLSVIAAIALSATAAPAFADPAPLTLGQEVSGSLSTGDETGPRNALADRYSLTLEQGQSVRIELSSDQFDGYLMVLDSRGRPLAEDDDSGGANNPRIRFVASGNETYTVVATGYDESARGAYRLLAAAWRQNPVQTTRVTLPFERNDELADSDGMRGTGQSVDAYVFDGSAGESIVATMRASYDSYLMLIGPTGEVVAEDDDGAGGTDARIRFTLPNSGEYRLLATAFDDNTRGAYSVNIVVGGSPEATTATPLRAGELTRGELTRSDAGVSTPRYSFAARAGQLIDARLSSSSFDALLSLAGPTGDVLGSDDDSGGGTNARVRVVAPADGTYTLTASSFDEKQGEYVVSVDLQTPAPVAARRVRLGQPQNGKFETTDARLVAGDAVVDVYTFEGRAGQRIRATVDSHAGGRVRITAPTGELLPEPPNSASTSQTATLPVTGVYTVAVSATVEQDTPYKFLLENAPVASDDAPRTALTFGQAVKAELKSGDGIRSDNGGLMDIYELRVEERSMVEIRMSSREIDTLLELQSADGHVIASNDDAEGTDAVIREPLAPGVYRVVATEFQNAPGSYDLVATRVADQPVVIEEIAVGATVIGRIEPTDVRVSGGRAPADVYRMRLEAGQQVTIRMHSESLDSQLRVLDETAFVVAENDDYGQGLDARVSFTASAAGEFKILCGSYGEPRPGTGANEYRLEVTAGLATGDGTEL
jgi:hypothetical protein